MAAGRILLQCHRIDTRIAGSGHYLFAGGRYPESLRVERDMKDNRNEKEQRLPVALFVDAI
jgi:hypothetical protein